MGKVVKNLGKCQTKLQWWSKRFFGNITIELAGEKKSLAMGGNGVEMMMGPKDEILELLMKEEKMWQESSKTHWLNSGDKNTSYFHSKASQRYRKNRILGLFSRC